jgi:Ser/Thr protein kinase RdoA (MazF antagonist)
MIPHAPGYSPIPALKLGLSSILLPCRSFIDSFLVDWDTHYQDLLSLPCQLCHSDANEMNLIMDPEQEDQV